MSSYLRALVPNFWTLSRKRAYVSWPRSIFMGVIPMARWASLIAEGVDQINPIRIYWWLIVFPGSFLVVALLAFGFVGDGLRDAWDVRAEK